MILSGSSDIIQKCEFMESGKQVGCQRLTFANNLVLVISETFLALYKNEACIEDELGNGLSALVELSSDDQLQQTEQGLVREFRAGYVGLMDEKVILITPNDIQLFHNKQDALGNKNEITRLKLA
ncbi:MAG: hypothetical protein V7785_24110 [Bermanella sp.]